MSENKPVKKTIQEMCKEMAERGQTVRKTDRYCKKCDKTKKLNEFYETDRAMCKDCKKDYVKKKYQTDKVKNSGVKKESQTEISRKKISYLEKRLELMELIVQELVELVPKKTQDKIYEYLNEDTSQHHLEDKSNIVVSEADDSDDGDENIIDKKALREDNKKLAILYTKRRITKNKLESTNKKEVEYYEIKKSFDTLVQEYMKLMKEYEEKYNKTPTKSYFQNFYTKYKDEYL